MGMSSRAKNLVRATRGIAGTVFGLAILALQSHAQSSPPPRAIRRAIPMTKMIRRAYQAGTRDSSGRPGARYWQLYTEYTIRARLDPATGRVSGHETIVVRNTSPNPWPDIVLRLYQNVYGANVPRSEKVGEITDGMQLTHLVVNGKAVPLHPDTAPPAPNAPRQITAIDLDQTVARLYLPTPIPSNETATIEAEWNFTVPHVAPQDRGMRMGAWSDTLFEVAQWYPQLAMYDDLREGGWDGEPYLGGAEFYNNYGHFDVQLDLPAGWLVGATGVLRNPADVLTPTVRDRLAKVLDADTTIQHIVGVQDHGPGKATAAGSRLVWHFVADSVADFAWATSDRFVWDATRAHVPGAGTVPINMLYMAERAPWYAKAGSYARHALEFYSALWMPYAYPQLTLVDGPESGMEYPMFVMSRSNAADHETGHQWWPMMVGVNETWYGWMDEGFNEYMNVFSAQDRDHHSLTADSLGQQYGSTVGDEREAPMMWNSNYAGPFYTFQAYGKAPMMLSMLGSMVGDSAVIRAMRDYARAWRFKHPSPWDYMMFMNRALDQDLGWFWYAWLFTTESVDGSIQSVKPRGNLTVVTIRQDGEMPAPIILKVQLAPRGGSIHLPKGGRMLDSVNALVTYPADVWRGGARTTRLALDLGRRIEKITLDPFARIPDCDVTDNVWPRVAPAKGELPDRH